jgi:hypothetical protein
MDALFFRPYSFWRSIFKQKKRFANLALFWYRYSKFVYKPPSHDSVPCIVILRCVAIPRCHIDGVAPDVVERLLGTNYPSDDRPCLDPNPLKKDALMPVLRGRGQIRIISVAGAGATIKMFILFEFCTIYAKGEESEPHPFKLLDAVVKSLSHILLPS